MVRPCARLYSFVAICLSAAGQLCAEPATRIADPVGARVRGATPQMTRLIEEGVKRSRTFAALVSALNRTEVIVYVEETRSLPSGVTGQLAVTGSESQRYLRAQVLSNLDITEKIAVIAHELQHAVEVAEHEDVRDTNTLAALYERIGVAAPRGGYDTAAAQATGSRVRTEIG